VILTGGLGPTADDLTKETVAAYFGLEMREDPQSRADLEAWFSKSGREMTPNNLKQAAFPVGSHILPNARGTAPGCIVEKDGKIAAVLPGPPYEMSQMYEKYVEPFLKQRCLAGIHSRVLRLFGIGESSCEYQLRDLMQSANPTVAPYAGFGEVTLRLTVKCENDEDPGSWLDPLEQEIRSRVGQYVYAVGEEKLQAVVARLLCEKEKTLAVAESLTGGMICAQLVECPGVSAALLEGCVAYSNEAKMRTLGVREETLRAHGAVSQQTALEMAEGIRRHAGADFGLATTGIAGPGGATAEKPVGLVYIACAWQGGQTAMELRLRGDRERIRTLAALNALHLLRRQLITEE
jgi:nicotinamide-nucleotide amidase